MRKGCLSDTWKKCGSLPGEEHPAGVQPEQSLKASLCLECARNSKEASAPAVGSYLIFSFPSSNIEFLFF